MSSIFDKNFKFFHSAILEKTTISLIAKSIQNALNQLKLKKKLKNCSKNGFKQKTRPSALG